MREYHFKMCVCGYEYMQTFWEIIIAFILLRIDLPEIWVSVYVCVCDFSFENDIILLLLFLSLSLSLFVLLDLCAFAK